MAYFLCFFQGLKPWIAVFSSFPGHGVLWISITTFVLICLTTLIFTSRKQKPSLLVQEKSSTISSECSADVVEVESVEAEDPIIQINKESDDEEPDDHEEYLVRSSQDLYSESDIASMDQYSTSSEDSDQTNYSRQKRPDCSDDSMSDEEGLIEIAIPSGQYLSPEKDMKKKKLTDFSQEAKFQSIPLEFLAEINEMNEEDNLIEIDIYMGSIKCSKFGI
ncbi:unnamed protein product [Fraxinus pennsylvanica]|uniref:Transmembrane protein n=1 Tax=Fraxinus pennsylvanica TaxID=56036 RepID=A0AAD2EAP3_9LAMI|nr:unnamed protein product [Fraxinus pennsylvanica]